ncbi:hypothetical protein [Paenibacillus sp. MBLB4367]|uniref:hypothetical protein n=1 Tax=Paenibacillus sp. MBLB4367 TaxID=3384767 RepID=UPI00390826FF
MTNLETNHKQTASYSGLPIVIILFAVLLMSPVLYFTIQLLLGNEALFAINGYK